MSAATLLEVSGLTKVFTVGHGPRRHTVTAVDDVTFSLVAGSSLGIVGESGSGKSTIARMIIGAGRQTSGTIRFDGTELSASPSRGDLRERATRIQMVFQDPYTSLDPRQTVRSALDEVQRHLFDRSARDRAARSLEILGHVGMGTREAAALPADLSGGQRQRVAIARALIAEPTLLVLDEAVSALDVSVQAQVLNMLADLRRDLGVSMLSITHDLAVVRHIADDLIVMLRGEVVEQGGIDQVMDSPAHDYTRRLLGAHPRVGGLHDRKALR